MKERQKIINVRFYALRPSFTDTEPFGKPCIAYKTKTAKKRGIATGAVIYSVEADFYIRDTKGKYTESVLFDEKFLKGINITDDVFTDLIDCRSASKHYIQLLAGLPESGISAQEVELLSDIQAIINVNYCLFAAERLADTPLKDEYLQGVLKRLKSAIMTRDGTTIGGQYGKTASISLLKKVWLFCENEKTTLSRTVGMQKTNISRHITTPATMGLELAQKTPIQLADKPPEDIAKKLMSYTSRKARIEAAKALIEEGYKTLYMCFDKEPQAIPVIYTLMRCMDRAQRDMTYNGKTDDKEKAIVPKGTFNEDWTTFSISTADFAREFCLNYDSLPLSKKNDVLKEVKNVCRFISTTGCSILSENDNGEYILTSKTFFGLEWNTEKDFFKFVNIDKSLHEVYKTRGKCGDVGYTTQDYKIYEVLRSYVGKERKEITDAAVIAITHLLGLFTKYVDKEGKKYRIARDKAERNGEPVPENQIMEPFKIRVMDLTTWEKTKEKGKKEEYKKKHILPANGEQRNKVLALVENALSAGGIYMTLEEQDGKVPIITLRVDNDSAYNKLTKR